MNGTIPNCRKYLFSQNVRNTLKVRHYNNENFTYFTIMEIKVVTTSQRFLSLAQFEVLLWS